MSPELNYQVNFFKLNSPLMEYNRNVYSQNGEDGILEYIFSKLPATHSRYCVEFGAWDGKHLSNCFNLISNGGWYGLCIEANAQRYEVLVRTHEKNNRVTCLKSYVEFEGHNSLQNIMARVKFPHDFDLLSIDIDGPDYFIWEGLSNYIPKVIVIEFNPSIPNDVVFVQGRDMSLKQGASLLALILLGKKKGYELVCATACNAIFVRSEFYSLFPIQSNHIVELYPNGGGRIFHGYDSTVFTTGMPLLIWSGIKIEHEDLQVLPISLRKYSDSQSP